MKKIIVILLCILVFPHLALSDIMIPSLDQRMVNSCLKKPNPVMCLKRLAVANYTLAQYKLGNMLLEKRNYKKALYWYTKAAKQGHAESQAMVGFMYNDGQGVEHNIIKACAWWFLSNYSGSYDGISSLREAQKKMSKEQIKQAIELAKKLKKTIKEQPLKPIIFPDTEVGRVKSCYQQSKPFPCMQKLAAANNRIAQNDLAVMYSNGKGTSKNQKQAIYWLKQAAKQGFALSQYSLGAMYLYGKGVEADHIKAYAWLLIANHSDNSMGGHNIELAEADMSTSQINQAQELAKQLIKTIKKPQE